MITYPKLLIYYKPSRQDMPDILSITLSFSRLNPVDNTYKQKIIIERVDEHGEIKKIKMKEMHVNVEKIFEKIKEIDFDKKYTNNIDDDETFLIQYVDKRIYSSKREEVADILALFSFDELVKIPIYHYDIIKDMYEYTELVKALEKRKEELSDEHRVMLDIVFKIDPYDVFEHIYYLDVYLERFRDDAF